MPKVPQIVLTDSQEQEITECAAKGMTQKQIAYVFGMSEDTLQRRFAVPYKKGIALRNSSIQQKQYEVAMTGDRTLLIWLGKQWLNQSDKAELRVSEDLDIDELPVPEQKAQAARLN